MNESNSVVPEGEGFEVDYDGYNFRKHRKYETSNQWWAHFCLIGKDELENCQFKTKLVASLNGDELLAMAVNHFVGANYEKWLKNKSIKALGGLSPEQCLQTEYGKKRLKMLLLTMH